jgi:hypothetical protein
MHSSAYSEPSRLRDGGVLDCAKRLQDLERLQDLGGEMQKLERGIEGRRGGAQTRVEPTLLPAPGGSHGRRKREWAP